MGKKLKNFISLKISGIWQKTWGKPPLAVWAAYISKSYMKSKKNASQTDDRAKSYGILKFSNFYVHFMFVQLSWMLISLYLPVDLAKTYENEWSHCSNDQSIKNLWLPEVRNLLMQCYATQYCNGTSMT